MNPEQDVEHVTAFIVHRLMTFVRLVLVAALALYTLPTASLAMHGDMGASYAAQRTSEMAAHVHEADHAHGNGAHVHGAMGDHHTASADHHQQNADQDCCSDFCLNLALVSGTPEFGRVTSSPVLVHANDTRVTAEPILINRPPART